MVGPPGDRMPIRLPVRRYAWSMASGFVGRGVELALLEGVCLQAQREGRPAAALVTGLPGSGKTRLLAELRSHQTRRPFSVVGYSTRAPGGRGGSPPRAHKGARRRPEA